jgi:hypothetical protein
MLGVKNTELCTEAMAKLQGELKEEGQSAASLVAGIL